MDSNLDSLLNVKPEEVTGLLEEFQAKSFASDKDIRFFFVRFQENLPRVDHFVSLLCDKIITYCLKREKFHGKDLTSARRLYLEAKRKFTQPKNGKTGEPGELIIYFLLEGCLGAPKVFSKMSLKTNNQMHVHGADGVHLGLDGKDIFLYIGESKLYGVHTAAINEALESVKEFLSPKKNTSYSQQEFEINVISDNLDIPEGDLRDRLLNALNPYSAERDNLRYIYTCFIGFDMSELGSKLITEDFLGIYALRAKSCFDHLIKKVNEDPALKDLRWQFFFIPFGSVEQFRQKFLDELKA